MEQEVSCAVCNQNFPGRPAPEVPGACWGGPKLLLLLGLLPCRCLSGEETGKYCDLGESTHEVPSTVSLGETGLDRHKLTDDKMS